MENSQFPKGQRITSPGGPGEVLEVIGEHVTVKLDNGQTQTFSMDEITDDSNAG